MYDDPIVAEIRAFRDEYAQQFDYDLDRICVDLQQKYSNEQFESLREANNDTEKRQFDGRRSPRIP